MLHKPFVEKPRDADDHHVRIYRANGTCRELFRKTHNKVGEELDVVRGVRRDGCYLYEQFIETNGTDVKLFYVCNDVDDNDNDLCIAETRPAPSTGALSLQRDSGTGKQIRQQVDVLDDELTAARRIAAALKHRAFGFDVLRTTENDKIYVCDVNGWSHVINDAYIQRFVDMLLAICYCTLENDDSP